MRRTTLVLIILSSACARLAESGLGPGVDAGPVEADAGASKAGPDGGLGDAGACGGSAEALMGCVDSSRYQQDLARVTGARSPGTVHWQQSQDLCAERLAALGYQVERHAYSTGVNVVGVLPGGGLPSERVLLSAHYDSVYGCSGADDNASGVAGLLEAARVLAQGRYRRTLVVACWDQEERGLLGSSAYAQRAARDQENLTAAFVLEMIGYRDTAEGTQTLPQGLELVFPAQVAAVHANGDRADFVALVGDTGAHAALTRLDVRARQVALPTMVLEVTQAQKIHRDFSELRRSDHASFWDLDVGALMITDTSNFRNPHYHCLNGPDAVADLDGAFATQVVMATVGAVADALELR